MRSDLIGLNDIHLNYLHFGDETHSYDVSDDSHEDVVLQKKKNYFIKSFKYLKRLKVIQSDLFCTGERSRLESFSICNFLSEGFALILCNVNIVQIFETIVIILIVSSFKDFEKAF